jgi:transcriptional regulator with XRE-family HTH domain
MQTIGERLEDARKKKGVSIREAAEATKIRGDYLQKLESNQFDIGLKNIYVRGFLRNYATFLRLPTERILSDFEDLGHGEARVRQPSREVYGRMDVSVASADDRPERAGTASAEPSPSELSRHPSNVGQAPHVLRNHATGLPPASSISPNAIFKGGIVLVCVLAFFLIIWAMVSLFGGGSSRPAERVPAQAPVVSAAAEATINLIALDSVGVRVSSLTDDGKNSVSVLFEGTLNRGQVQSVPWPGKIWIQANPGANLNVEYNGHRIRMPIDSTTHAASNQVILYGPGEMK